MINIFYGSTSYFDKQTPKDDTVSLSDLIENLGVRKIKNEGLSDKPEEIYEISNLIIQTDEYSILSDSGLSSFRTIINKYNIKNFYVQNPPQKIATILSDIKHQKIIEKRQNYSKFGIDELNAFSEKFNSNILGQEKVKSKLQRGLYRISKGYNKSKPLTVLFYGPTGVGKTETANFLSNLVEKKLFRKQFSMYQNNAFGDYLFGASHSANSFAQELLERESNIILLDEFDKANPIFYSAFYQMFDEGVFSDKNYTVHLEDSIIICTSNFLDDRHIKDSLGEPIYNRFDLIVEFDELNENSTKTILEMKYNKVRNELDSEDKTILDKYDCLSKVLALSPHLKNVREINRIVDDVIFATILKNKL